MYFHWSLEAANKKQCNKCILKTLPVNFPCRAQKIQHSPGTLYYTSYVQKACVNKNRATALHQETYQINYLIERDVKLNFYWGSFYFLRNDVGAVVKKQVLLESLQVFIVLFSTNCGEKRVKASPFRDPRAQRQWNTSRKL